MNSQHTNIQDSDNQAQNIDLDKLPKRIFLIGFMGSGKSYVGKRLAPKLGYEFIDLDRYIEEKSGKRIAEIFEAQGEAVFRQIESDVLKSTMAAEHLIVSTGGGTPCFFDHMNWMNANGMTIFLDVATPILVERLLPRTAHRPLLAGKSAEEVAAFIEQKLEERCFFYEQSKLIIRQTNPAQDRVDEIFELLNS